MRNYHQDVNEKKMFAFKVELRRAYHSINWSFIVQTLEAYGFQTKFVNLIKVHISSPSFSINVNGGHQVMGIKKRRH